MRRIPIAVLAAFLVTAAPASAFEAGGSARQVYVTDAEKGAAVTLTDAAGETVRKGKVNELGAELFRGVRPGEGYRVRIGSEQSESLTVLTEEPTPPSTDIYDQELTSDGYGYMTMRDGTKLAYSVHPATDVTGALGFPLPELPQGPAPVLVEYAGYGYARPSGPESGISLLANIMGFTVIDVNMRGTGCSGGAFDFFEPLQSLDGYDIVETVARQSWTANGKVGLFGISYGGISQLFTASTQPPSLAAITPVSLLDQVATTLYPGGILNTGFAFNWAKDRADEALPSGPEAGQEWAYERIQEGDETCKANQALHAEAPDLLGKVRANDTYRPKVADPLSPITFVDRINVPTFLACQNTDEQTGGHCPTLASRLTGTDKKWITLTNGPHIDSLMPETFNRLYDFLMLYVAKQPPMVNAARIQATAPLIYQEAMGIEGLSLPPDPVQNEPTYEGALAAFEAQPSVQILFDNGAGREPGQPYSGFTQGFDRYPPPGLKGRSWYFGAKGALSDARPKATGADAFTWNAAARPLDNYTGSGDSRPGGLWTDAPAYDWKQDPAGTAAAYRSAPLTADTTVIGSGAVTAWVKANKPDVDLQATISEVRPDGKEYFVQGGWLRTSMRALDKAKSTRLSPVLSLRAKHVKRLPRGRFTKVTIPLYYQSHAYREGSRIRVRISAPNGDQPVWAFKETVPGLKKRAKVQIGRGKRMPSSLLLPVQPGFDIPTELPPCPGLRGQPCRDFEPYRNKSVKRKP